MTQKPPAARELYGLEVIRTEMARVDAALKVPLDVYLLGGCAMSYLKLKASTKDLDLVMHDGDTLAMLEKALRDCGYKAVNLEKPYDQLLATALYKRPGAPQWDLYVGTVCGCLQLSPGMRERATLIEPGLPRLRIHACSAEDIFVFKSITERDADLDDLELFAARGVDWNIILSEMEWQRANSDTVWTVRFLDRMEELQARGIVTPIVARLRAVAEEDIEKAVGDKLPK